MDKKRTLPKRVNVCGKQFRIVETDLIEHHGECDSDKGQIRINPNLCMGRQEEIRDTLLHELLHAIEYNMKIEISHDDLSRLATVLIDTMDRNPHLKRYLFGD